jgi:cobalt-zinc-cadmium efflux system membrane fusion protein
MRFSGVVIKIVAGLALVIFLIGLPAAVLRWKQVGRQDFAAAAEEDDKGPQLVGSDMIGLPPQAVQSLSVETAEARQATEGRPLPPLSGSLALDANHLVRIHARFAGEVVQIGERADARTGDGRPLRFGDAVEKGQLLAVVWSKDLGEKKSELVDALSRLRVDEETMRRLQDAPGAVSDRALREAEQKVESDEIAVAKAQRTLRSWRLTPAEVREVEAEADYLHERYRRRVRGKQYTDADPPDEAEEERTRRWAQVEVRAPFAGTLLEKNTAVGDIVDTSADLFKIADLTHLSVWVHAYEEDLPALRELGPGPIHWTIRLKADPQAPPLHGTVDKIGDIIDPAQHTALVTGTVDNPQGRLRAGQFVTATIDLPAAPDEVSIPTQALVEDGRESVVFIRVKPERLSPAEVRAGYAYFAVRRVRVVRRYHDVVYVRSRLTDGDRRLTPAAQREGLQPPEALEAGEEVVRQGALEMRSALENLRSRKK